MKKFFSILALVVAVHTSHVARADDKPAPKTPAYTISNADLAIALANTDWKNERYRVQIFRKFKNSREEELMRIAEATYPPHQSVVESDRSSEADKKAPNLWWHGDFDGVRLPYAITTSAVIYYRQKIREFRAGDFKGSNNIEMLSAHMKYVSSIEYRTTYQADKRELRDVYLVKMQLDWSQFCGGTCAMAFNRQRTVVLSKAGAVFWVDGDGAQSVIVS